MKVYYDTLAGNADKYFRIGSLKLKEIYHHNTISSIYFWINLAQMTQGYVPIIKTFLFLNSDFIPLTRGHSDSYRVASLS